MSGRETSALRAILTADIRDFSTRLSADEESVIRLLVDFYYAVAERQTREYGGRVFRKEGDAVWCVFESASAAVQAGIGIQSEVLVRNLAVADAGRMGLRMGIHLGEVTLEPDGDVLGNALSVAKRLESACEEGAILISGEVQRQLSGRQLGFAFEDRGEIELKGVGTHRAFQGRPTAEHIRAIESGTGIRTAARRRRAIPILPILVITALAGGAAFLAWSHRDPLPGARAELAQRRVSEGPGAALDWARKQMAANPRLAALETEMPALADATLTAELPKKDASNRFMQMRMVIDDHPHDFDLLYAAALRAYEYGDVEYSAILFETATRYGHATTPESCKGLVEGLDSMTPCEAATVRDLAMRDCEKDARSWARQSIADPRTSGGFGNALLLLEKAGDPVAAAPDSLGLLAFLHRDRSAARVEAIAAEPDLTKRRRAIDLMATESSWCHDEPWPEETGRAISNARNALP